MKKRFCLYFTILLLLPCFVVAVPKYTSKKNAITLALAVEKGYYNGATILAAYAMNRQNNYYVAVTLSNGRTERWYISDIYNFSRDGKLNLRGNKVIVFPDADTDNFDILDKNLFHQIALKANAVREIYDQYENPLNGQSLLYKIKEFNLISPEDKSYGRDPYGYPYRYKVDLYSCNSILLSYRDVLGYLNNRQFLKDTSTRNLQPLAEPYQVTSITGFDKTLDKIYSQFGIMITFNKKIDLVPENFPVVIYETGSGAKDGQKVKQYIIDVIIPNTETKRVLRLNGSQRDTHLEYLNDVKLINNSRSKCQSILRASFNYELMDIPPYVTKIEDNKIYVTFFNITDQTVSEPPVTLADAREVVEDAKKWLDISPSIQVNSDFGRYYSSAIEMINAGYFEDNYNASVEKFKSGIELLEKAGLLSNTDNQLLEILKTRNSVRERIVFLSMEAANEEMRRDQPDRNKLTNLMANAQEYSDSPAQQKEIELFKRRAKL